MPTFGVAQAFYTQRLTVKVEIFSISILIDICVLFTGFFDKTPVFLEQFLNRQYYNKLLLKIVIKLCYPNLIIAFSLIRSRPESKG